MQFSSVLILTKINSFSYFTFSLNPTSLPALRLCLWTLFPNFILSGRNQSMGTGTMQHWFKNSSAFSAHQTQNFPSDQISFTSNSLWRKTESRYYQFNFEHNKCFVLYSIWICGSLLKRLHCKRYLNAPAKLQTHDAERCKPKCY